MCSHYEVAGTEAYSGVCVCVCSAPTFDETDGLGLTYSLRKLAVIADSMLTLRDFNLLGNECNKGGSTHGNVEEALL